MSDDNRPPDQPPETMTTTLPPGQDIVPATIVLCPCGSGEAFAACHGSVARPGSNGHAPLVMAGSAKLCKLDLGCGPTPKAGFEGVDLHHPANHKVDLFKFPFPWDDNSVDEIHCSHFVEHIPAREVEPRDLLDDNPQMRDRFVGQDMLMAFFDECWRVLKHMSALTVIVPALRSNRAFMDPTHRRFIAQETFLYLNAEWRKVNRPGIGKCDFGVNVNHSMPAEMGALSPEAFARRFNECWNVAFDWIANLETHKT